MDSIKPSTLTIGFVGASHLAYVSAIAAAEKSNGAWKIVCYAEEHTFKSINEPNLHEFHEKNKNLITFTTSIKDLFPCDLVYVAIDVPTNDKGQSDLSSISNTINTIKGHINSTATLVILSQVHPGYTRSIEFDKNRLFYQVETLIFGRAVERALYPERYIVGSVCKETPLPEKFQNFLRYYQCPIFQMMYESAELAKISINMYLTATVTTTNMLAELSQKVNANWNDIAETLKLDRRIGPYAYLKPGLGIAGGNLERDIATLQKIAFDQGAFVKFLDAQIEDSQFRSNWALRKFNENSNVDSLSIGVLGLAYKENTHSLKNSASLKFIKAIKDCYSVAAFDPIVRNIDGLNNLSITGNAQDLINHSNFLAILTPWPEFLSLDYSNFRGTILDPYQIIKKSPKNAQIHTLGKN